MLTARFFQVYDGFRSDIVHAYSANACFSFMALRSAPAYVQPSTVGSPLSTVAAAQFTRGWSPRVFVQAGPARSANGRLHSQQSQSVGGQGQHARVWYVAGMPRTTLPSSATLVVVRMFSYAPPPPPPPPHPFCPYTLPVQWGYTDRRLQLLRYGPASIQQFLGTLPPTQHLVESCRVDAWQFTQAPTPMLFIFVHGDFVERT